MNGKIGVDSTLGHGSTFWVEIPATKQHHIRSGNIIDALNEQKDICSILYIEDNVSNLNVIEQMLQYFDQLKLISAHNGNYGIELAKEYKPDLILLDINLPDINGYQVLNVLRSNTITKEIPVIALSADGLPINVQRGLEAGFDEYLVKPLNLDVLMETLSRIWDGEKIAHNGDVSI